jgi:hypothetical protein
MATNSGMTFSRSWQQSLISKYTMMTETKYYDDRNQVVKSKQDHRKVLDRLEL